MTLVFIALAAVLAFLLGSVPFAVVVSRAFGLADPRTFGSGNPGATNVLRSGNKQAALLTLLGDAAKGWLAVWVVRQFGGAWFGDAHGLAVAAVALAVFAGHVWSVFLQFKGGKGVATAAGVLLGLNVWLGLGVLACWLLVAFVTRYSSLAALVAAVFAPLAGVWVLNFRAPLAAVAIMSAILIWRHAENIKRLLAGQEGRIGAKKAAPAETSSSE